MNQENMLAFQRTDAYVVAREIARVVFAAKIRDAEIRDQAQRAAGSTFLRLSEGLPMEGVPMRRKYFQESTGSLCEVVAAMDLASVVGAAKAGDAEAVQALGLRLTRMLRALLR